jgi:hypothetical protein
MAAPAPAPTAAPVTVPQADVISPTINTPAIASILDLFMICVLS